MNIDIVRAWKDEDYRDYLRGDDDDDNQNEGDKLPDNPVGDEDLTEEQLKDVSGGMMPSTKHTQCADDGCGTVYC